MIQWRVAQSLIVLLALLLVIVGISFSLLYDFKDLSDLVKAVSDYVGNE